MNVKKTEKNENTRFMTLEELKNIYMENLRQFRFEKKMTQEQLAEKAEITQKFLSDIETGRKWGSFETLLSIANALEVEPYELFLPQNQIVNYDSRRTKKLMLKLRGNLNDLMDTVENFLEEK